MLDLHMMATAYMRRVRYEADVQAMAIWEFFGKAMSKESEPKPVSADFMFGIGKQR